MLKDNDHVKKETEGKKDVGEVGGEPGDQEQVVVGDAAPGGQEVGRDQEDIDEDRQQEERLRVLIRRLVLSRFIILAFDIERNLLEVGLGVGEEDEVDDEERSVEHEVGAGNQDGAGAGAKLEACHVVFFHNQDKESSYHKS